MFTLCRDMPRDAACLRAALARYHDIDISALDARVDAHDDYKSERRCC